MRSGIAGLFLTACLAHADFVPEKWTLRRPVQAASDAPVAAIALDPTVYAGSRERLSDLRLVRSGTEAPYVLELLAPTLETKEFQPKMLNLAAVPGVGVQATLDLGGHARNNRLRIESSSVNFQQKLRIDSGDDAKHWATVLQDAIVFDITQTDRHAALLSATYPLSTRRYLRLTVFGWTDPARLTGAWVSYQTENSGARDVLVTVSPQVTSDGWVADLGAAGIPHDALDIEIPQTAGNLFYRIADVETSIDGKNWYGCGSGILARTADREQLSIHFPEQWDRYIRLRVHNGDNPPLTPGKIAFSAWRRVLKFRPQASGDWFLYYGNAEAKTVSYDLSWSANLEGAQPAGLGAQETNPAYREPVAPWSERHMSLLYTVLILAVLAMGTVSVRFLMKVSTG